MNATRVFALGICALLCATNATACALGDDESLLADGQALDEEPEPPCVGQGCDLSPGESPPAGPDWSCVGGHVRGVLTPSSASSAFVRRTHGALQTSEA